MCNKLASHHQEIDDISLFLLRQVELILLQRVCVYRTFKWTLQSNYCVNKSVYMAWSNLMGDYEIWYKSANMGPTGTILPAPQNETLSLVSCLSFHLLIPTWKSFVFCHPNCVLSATAIKRGGKNSNNLFLRSVKLLCDLFTNVFIWQLR